MSSQIFWSSASTFATYSFAYDACCSLSCFLCCVQCVPLCQQFQLHTGHLLRLDNLLDLNFHLMFSFLGFLRCNRPGFSSDLYLFAAPPVVSVSLPFRLGGFLFVESNLLFNLDLVFSRFLGNLQFLFCCHVSMTFSILVSRHRSNYFLRDIVLIVRLGLQLALLFQFF